MLTNIDYRVNKWGNNEWLQSWRNSIEKDDLIYFSENELTKVPFWK